MRFTGSIVTFARSSAWSSRWGSKRLGPYVLLAGQLKSASPLSPLSAVPSGAPKGASGQGAELAPVFRLAGLAPRQQGQSTRARLPRRAKTRRPAVRA